MRRGPDEGRTGIASLRVGGGSWHLGRWPSREDMGEKPMLRLDLLKQDGSKEKFVESKATGSSPTGSRFRSMFGFTMGMGIGIRVSPRLVLMAEARPEFPLPTTGKLG